MKVENMSHSERAATPPALAQWLVDEVRSTCDSDRVAALWVATGGVYTRFGNQVEVWDLAANARRYHGLAPIVAHPPCGPWGKYASRSRESKVDGLLALYMLHWYGGVVEQPASSKLFRYQCPCAWRTTGPQSSWGHRAEKQTHLLWHRR
jgi:hypothetical protein